MIKNARGCLTTIDVITLMRSGPIETVVKCNAMVSIICYLHTETVLLDIEKNGTRTY